MNPLIYGDLDERRFLINAAYDKVNGIAQFNIGTAPASMMVDYFLPIPTRGETGLEIEGVLSCDCPVGVVFEIFMVSESDQGVFSAHRVYRTTHRRDANGNNAAPEKIRVPVVLDGTPMGIQEMPIFSRFLLRATPARPITGTGQVGSATFQLTRAIRAFNNPISDVTALELYTNTLTIEDSVEYTDDPVEILDVTLSPVVGQGVASLVQGGVSYSVSVNGLAHGSYRVTYHTAPFAWVDEYWDDVVLLLNFDIVTNPSEVIDQSGYASHAMITEGVYGDGITRLANQDAIAYSGEYGMGWTWYGTPGMAPDNTNSRQVTHQGAQLIPPTLNEGEFIGAGGGMVSYPPEVFILEFAFCRNAYNSYRTSPLFSWQPHAGYTTDGYVGENDALEFYFGSEYEGAFMYRTNRTEEFQGMIVQGTESNFVAIPSDGEYVQVQMVGAYDTNRWGLSIAVNVFFNQVWQGVLFWPMSHVDPEHPDLTPRFSYGWPAVPNGAPLPFFPESDDWLDSLRLTLNRGRGFSAIDNTPTIPPFIVPYPLGPGAG